MLIIGLTGSIGMGKSEAVKIFGSLGVPIHDADLCVHELYKTDAVPLLKKLFPDVISAEGVDRFKLMKKLLGSDTTLNAVEEVVHPLVREKRRLFCERQRQNQEKIVVMDIPLLFESESELEVDIIITVDAPESVQKSRVLGRPGMTYEKMEWIMSRQSPNEAKRKKSHFVIDSSRGLSSARRQIEGFLRALAAA